MRYCPRMRFSFLFAFLLVAGSARADVIATPPDSCPLGSMVIDFCHGPPTCAATTCETSDDCGDGLECGQVRACVREHCCSGRCCGGGCGSEPTIYTHFSRLCTDAACTDPGTSCESVRVCVPAESDAGTDAGESDAGGDDAGGDDAGGADAGDDDAGEDDAGETDTGGTDTGGGADAGPSGTGGGCCAVFGGREGTGAALVSMLLFAVVARRRWSR